MSISLRGPRTRSAAVVLAVAALLAGGTEAVVARAIAVPAAAPAAAPVPVTVEDEGAGCPVSLPGTLTADAKLPDPFTRLNGTRISSTSDWTCRREEIVQLAEKYVYGAKPPKPASVTGTVTRTGITVNVSDSGKSASSPRRSRCRAPVPDRSRPSWSTAASARTRTRSWPPAPP